MSLMGKINPQRCALKPIRTGKRTAGVRKPRQALLQSAAKSKDVDNKEHVSKDPPNYVHIERNEFLHRGHRKQKEEDIPSCECKYDADDPESMCGERCLNALTSTECTPGYCPCGENCKNQRFQRCQYAKSKLVKTSERGWGLLADQDIKAGDFVIEYCGEVISCKEARKRSHTYETTGLIDAYIISLDRYELIDATKKGSHARFINHSCEPNCETRKWTVLGEIRVGIFAKQDISCGTELSYDYNFQWYGGAKVRCLCGGLSCVGFLGAKSRGFQNDSYLWEDNDDRYSVEDVPLYDSDEDEPLSNFLKRAKICKKLKLAAGKNNHNTERSVTPPNLAENSYSNPAIELKGGETLLATVKAEKLTLLDLAEAALSNEEKEAFGGIPKNNGVDSENERKTISLLESLSMAVAKDMEKETKENKVEAIKRENCTIVNDRGSFDLKIDASEDDHLKVAIQNKSHSQRTVQNKKSSYITYKKSKNSSNKIINAKPISQLEPSKITSSEVLNAMENKNTAVEKLNALYDKIRPNIEEHGNDGQHNVPTSVAEEWIEADCENLKATFDFHFSVIKKLPIQILTNQMVDQTNLKRKAGEPLFE